VTKLGAPGLDPETWDLSGLQATELNSESLTNRTKPISGLLLAVPYGHNGGTPS
jgi:hypothetical protein